MPTVEKEIHVNAPLTRVFDLWSDFERFPEFMNNVKEVRRLGGNRTHWVAEAAGQHVEWDARTTVEEPSTVAWEAEGDSRQRGVVTFDEEGPERTLVRVSMDYDLPSRWRELGAKWFGIDGAIVENDLERFKDLVETGHTDVTDRSRV